MSFITNDINNVFYYKSHVYNIIFTKLRKGGKQSPLRYPQGHNSHVPGKLM